MQTVPMYAAVLAVVFVALSVRTLRVRRKLKIGMGDGGNKEMLRAMRVHSNFAEYVPLSLLVLFFVEGKGAGPWVIHFLAGSLLLGRLLHAYGVSQSPERFVFRVVGMAMTFTTLLGCAAYLIFPFDSLRN